MQKRLRGRALLERKLGEQAAKIERIEKELAKAYEEYSRIQEDIDREDAMKVFEAFKKSNKTLDQLMTFLAK